MNFMDIFDTQPRIRVCDIIHLFLIGGDDKIYMNLSTPNKKDIMMIIYCNANALFVKVGLLIMNAI